MHISQINILYLQFFAGLFKQALIFILKWVNIYIFEKRKIVFYRSLQNKYYNGNYYTIYTTLLYYQ